MPRHRVHRQSSPKNEVKRKRVPAVNSRPSGPFMEGNVRRPNRDKKGAIRKANFLLPPLEVSVTTEALAKQPGTSGDRHASLLKSLTEFTTQHRTARWSGTFGEFLQKIFPS